MTNEIVIRSIGTLVPTGTVSVTDTRHAVVTRGSGGAIVSCVTQDDDHRQITAIERFPYAVEPLVAWARRLRQDEPRSMIVVDVEGLGDAVWQLLGEPRERYWTLYDKHGRDREELTRVLLVAVAERSFTFARDVDHLDAMKRALAAMTRAVREDGPGSELTTALSLALNDHRPPPPNVW